VLIIAWIRTERILRNPATAAFPRSERAKVNARELWRQERLKAVGYDTHICLTDFGDTGGNGRT
jgi:hypothetical protein